MRKQTIWKEKESEIKALFLSEQTAIDIIRKLGLQSNTTSYRSLKHFAHLHSLEIPKLSQSEISKTRGAVNRFKRSPLDEEVFVEHSTYSRRLLMKRLLSAGYLEYKCYGQVCNDSQISLDSWQGISLQLEHKNGISDDNRLPNLEFLCPNCHSMTDTFAGRNKARYENGAHGQCENCGRVSKKKLCVICGPKQIKLSQVSLETIIRQIESLGEKAVTEQYGVSVSNFRSSLNIRVETLIVAKNKSQEKELRGYPLPFLLKEEVENSSYVQVAQKYGVSDNAIRKHLIARLGKENLPKKHAK